MGIAFADAINAHTKHQCRLITKTTRYNFNFKKDLHIPDLETQNAPASTDRAESSGFDEIVQLLRDADIIHFHILADENMELGPVKVKDFVNGKPLLHHHHGHPDFRTHPEKYSEKYRRLKRKVLVSTPDLLTWLPEATWQPNLVPINDPLYLPHPADGNGSVLIGQAATRKDLKNTEDLIRVVGDMKQSKACPKIDLDIIEDTDHRECLKRKGRCHVVFDHMQGYYGVSSLESLSQGKPVIAGLDDWNISHIKEYTGAHLVPWEVCRTIEDLKGALTALSSDMDLAEEIGRRNRAFMCEYWSDKKIVETLIGIYKGL